MGEKAKPLLDRIGSHIRQLAPHMTQREGVKLLCEARDEIVQLRAELESALDNQCRCDAHIK